MSLKLEFLINFGSLFLPALSGPGGRLVWAVSPAPAILPAWCLLRLHHRSRPTQATVSPWPTDTPNNTLLQFLLLHDSSETTRHGPRTLPRRGCTQVPVKGAWKALPRHEQVVATRASGGTRISPAGSSGDGPGPPAPPTAPGDSGAVTGRVTAWQECSSKSSKCSQEGLREAGLELICSFSRLPSA